MSSSALCTGALWRVAVPARLLDALERPAIAAASKDHPRRIAAPAGHEVGPILLDAGPVVHEHKSQVIERPPGPRLLKGATSRSLEQRPIPALIGSPGLLQRPIGLRDIRGNLRLVLSDIAPRSDEPANEQQQNQPRYNDENDAQRGHGHAV